jgi:transcriptional regulator with XRE-family HTH domain
MIIGQRIQQRLDECGISQAALARRVKLNQSTINGLVRGDQHSSTKLHEIARELRTTPAFLTGETDDPESDAPAPVVTGEEKEWLGLLHSLESSDRALIIRLTQSLGEKTTAPTLHDQRAQYRTGTHG